VAVQGFVFYVSGAVQTPEEISPAQLDQYVEIRARMFADKHGRPIPPWEQTALRASVRLFVKFLATQGIPTALVGPAKPDLRVVPGYEALLDEFHRFLVEQRGLAPRTAGVYLGRASELCRAMVEAGAKGWDKLTPKLLYDHLRSKARRTGHLFLRVTQTGLRAFFRFLRLTGRCEKDLAAYLIHYTTFSQARVPKTLPPDDLYRIFDSMKRNRPGDIRDRAIFLLLTFYGLRIGEVARLRLEDIRWPEEKLILRARKMGRDLVLPLHPGVARALSDYIQRVRPPFPEHREVFIKRQRHGPYRSGSELKSTIRFRLERLGLAIGPHALRHSLGSRLINNGCPPAWIQQLLGHASLESTRIYAKVDLAHLSEVADNDGVNDG
jgi:site-specific recombinase XerD